MLGALVSHEPIDDSVFIKQYLKIDFQAFEEEWLAKVRLF